MERRNDDYSDGHERYRQAPHGRPLESYEGTFFIFVFEKKLKKYFNNF